MIILTWMRLLRLVDSRGQYF